MRFLVDANLSHGSVLLSCIRSSVAARYGNSFLYLYQTSRAIQEVSYCGYFGMWFHLEAEVAETTVSAG